MILFDQSQVSCRLVAILIWAGDERKREAFLSGVRPWKAHRFGYGTTLGEILIREYSWRCEDFSNNV